MSSDRFVRWDKTVPTKDQIGEVLTDFLSGLATSVEWKEDRWFATLVGVNAPNMFNRQLDNPRFHEEGRERWIEVWVKGKTMDVMTRMHDDATMALAQEFAKRCAKFWEGKLDDG